MRRTWVLLIAVVALLIPPGTALAAPLEKVVDRPNVGESEPSRSAGYLGYTLFRRRTANAFVVPDGGPRMRVNPDGTASASSSLDGTTFAYDQIRGSDSNIKLFDVVTQTRMPLPNVNTDSWESDPALSGDWLMIWRTDANLVPARNATQQLILINLTTDEERVLVDLPSRGWYLETDQVNGDWAAYESCRFSRGQFSECNVFRYRISTENVRMIPNPGLQQGAAGVSDDGTMYFSRSGRPNRWGCGVNSKIMRKPVGGPAVVISRLRDDFDLINGSFAFEEADTSTTLYVTRFNCRRQVSGVYRVTNADTATA